MKIEEEPEIKNPLISQKFMYQPFIKSYFLLFFNKKLFRFISYLNVINNRMCLILVLDLYIYEWLYLILQVLIIFSYVYYNNTY